MQFLQNNEIDKLQWDECIHTSPHGLIYAQSFYLDNMCPGWKALTGKKYEWVLPLTNKRKLGISYLYQPPFTQQLGVFAKPGIIVPLPEIIEFVKLQYKFWEINWNYAADHIAFPSHFQITPATNFILDLKDYESIIIHYHNDLIKNLHRSNRFTHVYNTTTDFCTCINMYRKYYGDRMPHVTTADYKKFSNVCSGALQTHQLQCREAVDTRGEILAIVLLFTDGRRIYNIMNVTTEAGRKTQANHFLLDAIIREHAGADMIFDFEGSDVPGVNLFYKNFGAVNQPYFMIKYNNLTWPLNLIKK